MYLQVIGSLSSELFVCGLFSEIIVSPVLIGISTPSILSCSFYTVDLI